MLKKYASCLFLSVYLLTFCTLPARAGVPLAIIAAASIGAAMVASSTGAYYAKNGQAPEYVSNVANAVASASDRIFQPSYLAVGPIALVTAASFPQKATVYLGKEAAIGAQIGDIVNFLNTEAGNTYTEWKDYLTDFMIPGGYPNTSINSTMNNNVYQTDHDNNVKFVFSNTTGTYSDPVVGLYDPAYSRFSLVPNGFCANISPAPSVTGTYYCYTGERYNASIPYKLYIFNGTASSLPALQPSVDAVNYPGLKDNFENGPPAGVATETPNLIAALPADQKIKADDVPATGTGTPPVALTPADLQAALAANTAQVAEAVKQAADNRLAADPTNTALQTAADQAALDLAKAQAEAEKEEVKEEDMTASTPGLDARDIAEIDFSPITNLSTEFSSVFPFGLITSIASGFGGLDSSPITPSFTIDLGLTQKEVNFSSFDSFASIIRSILSFLMYGLTGFFCFKLYART